MRRLISMVFGMLLGGGLVYAGFHYHLVRTNDDWLVVPRGNVTFEDAYVDLREWKGNEWAKHGQLARDLVAAGHGELIVESASQGLFDQVFNSAADHLDH